MRRKLVFLVTLLLCISLLISGCVVNKTPNATDPVGSSEEDSSIVTPAGQFPVVKEKITLKVFSMQLPQIENFETNAYTKFLEEKTNIHLEWELSPQQDASTKVSLMLTSDTDLPDMFLPSLVNRNGQMQYGQQGLFLPLNEYIEKYGIETKKLLEIHPEAIQKITCPDGNIYSMFTAQEVLNQEYRCRMWINKPWLDNLSMAIPTTTDELYTVLKAFKDDDPNKNNKADEIPLTGAKGTKGERVDSFIMNAFVYNDTWQRRIHLNNGKVTPSFNQPAYKEGISYYRKLAEENLFDPLSFTQDKNQLKQLVNHEEINIVGTIMGEQYRGFAGEGSERLKDYVPVLPLKGPNGFQAAIHRPGEVKANYCIITKACEYPEAAFRMADFMLSEEASLFARFGKKGVDWVEPEPGEIGVNGKQAVVKEVLKWGDVQNSNWYTTGFYYVPRDVQDGMVIDKNNPFDFELLVYNLAKSYAPFKWEGIEPFRTPFLEADEESEQSLLISQIESYVEERFAAMVLDKNIDLDREWDAYLKELDKLQLDRYVEILQNAYDREVAASK